jgi:hypothetical protein
MSWIRRALHTSSVVCSPDSMPLLGLRPPLFSTEGASRVRMRLNKPNPACRCAKRGNIR